MYSDKKQNISGRIILIVIIILALAAAITAFSLSGSREIKEDGAAAIRQMIEKTALQCYVVEGNYPSTVEYLEEHYGIQINRNEYLVVYEAFASNLPPTVRVMAIQK